MPDAAPRHRYQHHDATPGAAADRSAKTASRDSFPASDPMATTAVVGSRAVDPARLMRPRVEIRSATTVSAQLPDPESAKLTVEYLVRKLPLDRRRITERSGEDGTVILEVAAPEEVGAERIAEMLRRYGGQDD
jgi:hypothetical protein